MTFFRKFYLKISNFVQLEANLARMYERVRRETLKNNAVTRNEQKRLFSLLFIIRKLLLFKHIFHSGFSLWFLNLFSLSFCLSTCFFLTDDLSLVFNRETVFSYTTVQSALHDRSSARMQLHAVAPSRNWALHANIKSSTLFFLLLSLWNSDCVYLNWLIRTSIHYEKFTPSSPDKKID
jgi:hypothetical protein